MNEIIKALQEYVKQKPAMDCKSVLEMLYEYHSEHQTYDNDQIRTSFHLLYQQMGDMPLKEMDKIIYPVCDLCRNHERSGFIAGIKIGIRLAEEVATE